MHRCDLDAVGVQIHPAGGVLHFEFVKCLVLARFPKNQIPAAAATGTAHHKSIRMNHVTPNDAFHAGGDVFLQHFLAVPFEAQNDRLVHRAQRIGALVQPAGDELLAVRRKRKAAHAAKVHALAAVVGV